MEKTDRVFNYLPEESSVGFLRSILVKLFGNRVMGYEIDGDIVSVVEIYQYKDRAYITKEMQIKLTTK